MCLTVCIYGTFYSFFNFFFFFCLGESKAEPAVEENLQEKASGTETTEPFIVDNKDDDMTTVTAFGVTFFIYLIMYSKTWLLSKINQCLNIYSFAFDQWSIL